jgi:hypothetical protein
MRDRIIHPSHIMSVPYCDIRCPASTPRFYTIRKCIKCGYEEVSHTAGYFLDNELELPCESDDPPSLPEPQNR